MESEILDLAREMPGVEVVREWLKGVLPTVLASAVNEECI